MLLLLLSYLKDKHKYTRTHKLTRLNMVNDINILKEDEKHLNLKLKEESLRDESKRARELFKSLKFDKEFKEGLSFLDLKNDTLLSYMIDVCNIVLLKAKQRSILGHQSVARCVEYRVIIEKIRAIDQKLAYQINKLVSLPDKQEDNRKVDVNNLAVDIGTDAEDGDADNDDDDDDDEAALSGDDTGDQDEDDDDDDDLSVSSGGVPDAKDDKRKSTVNKDKIGLYKAPKLRSVGSRKRTHDELYQDEDDDEQRDLYQDEQRRRVDDEVTRYEEDNYTRLPEKKSKRKQQRELQKSKKQQLKGKKGRRKSAPRHKSS